MKAQAPKLAGEALQGRNKGGAVTRTHTYNCMYVYVEHFYLLSTISPTFSLISPPELSRRCGRQSLAGYRLLAQQCRGHQRHGNNSTAEPESLQGVAGLELLMA